MFDTPIENREVGFVGIGQMGLPMAENVLEAGFSVTAYDTRREALDSFADLGGETASSPAEVAERCFGVHVVVVTDEQLHDVVSGDSGVFAGFERGDSGGILVVHSTVRPDTVTELAEKAPEGVTVVDVAISGGKPRAVSGDLTLMVGGDESAIDYYRPVLAPLSRDLFHLGRLGSGLATKLANNLIFHANELATLEALDLGSEYGVDEDQMREVFQQSTGDNYFVRNFEFFTEEYLETHPAGPHGPARNARKNLFQALTLANSIEVDVPLTALVSQRVPSIWHDLADDIESGNAE